MTSEIALVCPHPSRPPLTYAHRCIGNNTWHTMPTSARLMYRSVYVSRVESTPSPLSFRVSHGYFPPPPSPRFIRYTKLPKTWRSQEGTSDHILPPRGLSTVHGRWRFRRQGVNLDFQRHAVNCGTCRNGPRIERNTTTPTSVA